LARESRCPSIPAPRPPPVLINLTDESDGSSFDHSWPHGGYEANIEKDGDGSSNKENEWVVVTVDK